MKHNYIFNSVDTSNFKGDKPLKLEPRKKVKRAKIKKPHKSKVKYIIKSKRSGIWNIPNNF